MVPQYYSHTRRFCLDALQLPMHGIEIGATYNSSDNHACRHAASFQPPLWDGPNHNPDRPGGPVSRLHAYRPMDRLFMPTPRVVVDEIRTSSSLPRILINRPPLMVTPLFRQRSKTLRLYAVEEFQYL